MKNILFLLLILSIGCKEQNKKTEYFKDQKSGVILTQGQYDKAKVNKTEELKKYENLILKETILETITKGDSIVKTFELGYSMDLEALKEKEKKNRNKVIGTEFKFDDLITVNGKEISSKTLKGKPTLINLWYVACKPCIEEMPALNKIANKYSDKVNFISITFDSQQRVQSFLKKRDFDFTHIVNAESTIKSLGVNSYPKNIFLDKNGIVKEIRGGIEGKKVNGKIIAGDGEELIKFIENLL
jgi:cytochrome c biogenesis protein CcmG/thiol:disulfide interchange protein DsbE